MTFPEIHLCDVSPAQFEAWADVFAGVERVYVSRGDVRRYPVAVDAVVSPANSFGFMTGGIDLVYMQWLGMKVEENAQTTIRDRFFGELPVGQATIVPTGHPNVPWCVVAPTMRIPQPVPPINAYLSFRAALVAVLQWNASHDVEIRSILCPGMGTATGRIPAQDAAQLMHRAYVSLYDYDPSSELHNDVVVGYTPWP